ncbi:MAG: SusC/RagA family TonB-linked outer membrane protein [Saprospiraceae bacterium]
MRRNIYIILFFLFASMSAFAQIQVSGVVTDAQKGESLIGVNIKIKDSSKGTTSDIDGKFSLECAPDAVLEFTYIGFTTVIVNVEGKNSLNVQMSEDLKLLEEVVVVGYGVQKKSVVTGAISKVKAEDLENMPVTRIEQSLLGRTSGVRVTTASGQPGEGATVRIRGTTSINNSEPLYVVDGIPILGGIEYLNQGDIESIEVLKDAASAAIYGARAANGVIIVSTKKGATEQMQVNYHTYWGKQYPWKKLSLLNAREYGTLMNEASVAGGGGILFKDPTALGTGTDWQDEIFNNGALMRNHELSISAGSKKSQYFASAGYFDQDGIVARGNSNWKRFTMRFNSTHKITDRITFGNTISYANTTNIGVSTNSEYGSPLSRAMNLDPITPLIETDPTVIKSYNNFPVVKDENGNMYGISKYVTSEVLNPVAALRVAQGSNTADKIVGNAYVDVKIIKGLNFKSTLGADMATWGNESFQPIYYLNATNTNSITRYGRSQNRGLVWNLTNTLSYNVNLENHNITILGGTVGERNKGQGIGGGVEDIPVDNIKDASLGFPTPKLTQSFYGFEYLETTSSYFGRLIYNFKEKYLFTAILRRDGSSRFGSNNKYGNFPSLSAGWVVSEENFLRSVPAINFLKLRASWGINGNDNIGTFRYVSTVGGFRNYTFGTKDDLVNGVSPNAIANPDLRWEQTEQTDLGFDARFAKYWTLTMDVFSKKTKDMLLDIAVPGYIGNAGPIGNIATMSNRGIELELGFSKKMTDWNISFAGNCSYIENEVTFLGKDKKFLVGQRFSPQNLEITRTAIGLPLGYFFGYKTDGIFQNQNEVNAWVGTDGKPMQPNAKPGDFRFKDINSDGKIDADDRTNIGDPTPNWTYGFNFAAAYKGFDIVVFGQGVAGNQIFKATRRFDLQMANMTSDALGRWTGEGTSNTYPRLVMNDPNQNFSRSSDFYVERGDFFRIKTLQVGFTVPQRLSQKVGLNKCRLYVSGNNLLTITQYSGFDPEIGGGSFGVDRGFYPQSRFYLGGVQISF